MGVPVKPIPYLFPRDALDGARVNVVKALVNFALPSAFDLSVRRDIQTGNEGLCYACPSCLRLLEGIAKYLICNCCRHVRIPP